MELIEALEQLSLHVKSNGDSSFNDKNQIGYHQLHHFENSISTLLSQINDLETDDIQGTSNSYQTQQSHPAKSKRYNRSSVTAGFFGSGSIETSQEDDSDNSSQQSNSYALNTTHPNHISKKPTQSLIVNLMRRDLNSITNSVKNIGRILAKGSEIEFIYKNYFSNTTMIRPDEQHPTSYYCQTLCRSFMDLISCEAYVYDLPTIMHFTKYSELLMQQVCDADTTLPEAITACQKQNNYENELDAAYEENEQMCLDEARDALDYALLESDQKQLEGNWTDNKLYVESNDYTTFRK